MEHVRLVLHCCYESEYPSRCANQLCLAPLEPPYQFVGLGFADGRIAPRPFCSSCYDTFTLAKKAPELMTVLITVEKSPFCQTHGEEEIGQC